MPVPFIFRETIKGGQYSHEKPGEGLAGLLGNRFVTSLSLK